MNNDQTFFRNLSIGLALIGIPLLGFVAWTFFLSSPNPEPDLPSTPAENGPRNSSNEGPTSTDKNDSTYDGYQWKPGLEYIESIDLEDRTTLNFEHSSDSNKPTFTLDQKLVEHLSGTLEVQCYQYEDGTAFLGYRFRDVSRRQNKGNNSWTASNHKKIRMQENELQKGFFVEKTDSGTVKMVYLPEVTGNLSNLIQVIAFSKELRLPEDGLPKDRWNITGTNVIGTYNAHNQMISRGDELFITRTLGGYDSLNVTSKRPFSAGEQFESRKKGFEIKNLSSETTFQVSPEHDYPIRSEYREQLTILHGSKSGAEQDRTINAEVRLEEKNRRDSEEIRENLFRRWNVSSIRELKDQLRAVPPGRTITGKNVFSRKQRQQAWKQFKNALPTLRNLSKKHLKEGLYGQYMLKTVKMARKSPKVIEELKHMVYEVKNSITKRFALDLLAATGNEKSQKTLSEIFSDPSLSNNLRARALKSATFIQAPDQTLRKDVLKILKEAEPGSDLQGQALRVIGSAAGQYARSDRKISNQMFNVLKEFQKRDLNRSQKVALSDALGNTKRKEAIPLLQNFTKNEEPEGVQTTAVANIARNKDETWAEAAINTVTNMKKSRTAQTVSLKFFVRRDWDRYSKEFRKKTRKKIKDLKESSPYESVRDMAQHILVEMERSNK